MASELLVPESLEVSLDLESVLVSPGLDDPFEPDSDALDDFDPDDDRLSVL